MYNPFSFFAHKDSANKSTIQHEKSGLYARTIRLFNNSLS